MQTLWKKYKYHFTDKSFVLSFFLGWALLIASLIINFYAGTYATNNASQPVKDIILSNFPTYNVETIFIYGPLVLWVFVIGLGLIEPKRVPFVVKTVALFVLIRSVFITLTHIGPFPDQIALNLSPTAWLNRFTFGGDLFFSAHTGLPFLMSLVFWNNKFLRILFIVTSIFFGVIVLMGHLHYSIDVLSAFFITYTIYHLAEIIFKNDKECFDDTL